MSTEEPNGLDPAVGCEEPIVADPMELAIDGLRSHLESGDFARAKAFIKDQIGQADPDVAAGLEHQRARLGLDPVAIAVMAVCGALLAVVLAVTLFH